MAVSIVQKDHPVLRKVALEVPISAIKMPRIKKIIADMKSSLLEQNDGVAIAAPQIGESIRIFVVSGGIEAMLKGKDQKTDPIPDSVFINPKVTKLSKDKKLMEEGCLSVRWLYGKVRRAEKVTVEAYNEKGEKFTRGGTGLMAQIFQHEVDHLDGILFIDKAEEIENMPPQNSN